VPNNYTVVMDSQYINNINYNMAVHVDNTAAVLSSACCMHIRREAVVHAERSATQY